MDQTAIIDPAEVVTLITLVLPGFLALSIMLQIVGIAKKVDYQVIVIWSFFISGAIDLLLIVVLRMPLPPSSGQFVAALLTWGGAVAYVLLILGVAMGGAFLLRIQPGKRLRRLVWYGGKSARIPSLVWDDSLEAHFGQWVIADVDGKYVMGVLARNSTGDEPREVYLLKPELVTYDRNGNPSSRTMGEAALITGGSLKAIRFLTEPTDITTVPLADLGT